MKPEIKKALDNLAVIIDKRARYETGEEYVQIANDFRLIKAELEKPEDNGTDK
jgi:hypothetical protein